MNTELFFIYDSHCPWSYATTALVKSIHNAYPEINLNLWHTAHYDGSDSAGKQQADMVSKQSAANFGMDYIRNADRNKDATMTANVMAWVQNKQPSQVLDLLMAIQEQHFIYDNPLTDKDDFLDIIKTFKMSPPEKVFKTELSKDSDFALHQIADMQEIIETQAFPALLLAVDDKLVMLNHNLYLTNPDKIIEAVALELK